MNFSEAGEVLTDGVDLKKYLLNLPRQQLGLLLKRRLMQLLRFLMLLISLKNYPRLDTMVGDEHGTQYLVVKNRLAKTRAILNNPKILLLDEATSALDAESEQIVQEALEKVMAKRTTVVAAHRPTTFRNVDIIIVLYAGKLLEQVINSRKDRNRHKGAPDEEILLEATN